MSCTPTTADATDLRTRIRHWAQEAGFEAIGFTRPVLPARTADDLRGFLDAGYHGDMGWMATRVEQRTDPVALWDSVRTMISLGMNYGPDHDPMHGLHHKDRGLISVYAQGDDYHEVVKRQLKLLARRMVQELGGEVKVFVDTAPVMEKPLAAQTQLGWQGRHTCVVSRTYGSWLFLGEIFTTLELPPDAPHRPLCGQCSRCEDICPTQAIRSHGTVPGQLDARRCLSYLTIEHKGHIPEEFRPAMGNRIYGCDDCLAVCPWNKFAQTAQQVAFHARDALRMPPLAELALLDDAAFRTLFRKSPIKRIGRDRFVRNVLIAIGNSGDATLVRAAAVPLLDDASPLVRAMARWACRTVLPHTFPPHQYPETLASEAGIDDNTPVN